MRGLPAGAKVNEKYTKIEARGGGSVTLTTWHIGGQGGLAVLFLRRDRETQTENTQEIMGKNKNEKEEKIDNKEVEREEPVQSDTEAPQEEGQQEAAGEPSPEERIAELNDKYLRLYSDFDNFRRRASREKLDMIKTASSDVISSLLPVIDDMERAIQAFSKASGAEGAGVDDTQKALFEGVALVYNKMMNILKQQGLAECEVMGKPFQEDTAEAVAQIPAPDESGKGVVLDVVQKGYTLGDKVLRFAKVVVGC